LNSLGLKPNKLSKEKHHSSNLIYKILGKNTGLFRGFVLGQNFDYILSKEKFKQFESKDHYTGFSFANSNNEIVDILYFKDASNNLAKIQVDIFMNTEDENDFIFKSLYQIFFKKYGFPKAFENRYLWSQALDSKITLVKYQIRGDLGVSILYEK
jgi:hypothetical protein